MKRYTAGLLAVMAVLLIGPVGAQNKSDADTMLEAARQKETLEGDLKGAIQQYEGVVAKYAKTDRAVTAMALVRMAECYQEMGDAEARKIYERVVREYPEQKEAGDARARLATLDAGAPSGGDVTVQRLWAPDSHGVGYGFTVTSDGRYLWFYDSKSGGKLGVRDLKTGEDRMLPQGASGDCRPWATLLSPDGKQIALECGREPESIRLIGSDGAHMREIARLKGGEAFSLASWSPDAKQIAVAHSNADHTKELALISTADGSMTRLKSTGRDWPGIGGFSPDGQFLVYSWSSSSKTDGGVFAITIDGSRETKLVQDADNSHAPLWTPDGRAVLFISSRSGTQDLWSIQVENGRPQGNPELVRPHVGNIRLISFARDGSLYYAAQDGDFGVYTANFDPDTLMASSPARITDNFVRSNYDPALSPDGKLLALLRCPPDDCSVPERTLIIRSIADGAERTVPVKIATAASIRWYPDGRSVLLKEWSGNTKDRFRRIDIETGEAATVVETTRNSTTVELSRDGKTLFYTISTPTPRLVRRDLETGRETDLYRLQSADGSLDWPSLSPKGDQLAFFARTDSNKRALFTIPATGGAPHEVYAGTLQKLLQFNLAWTPDGRHLIASRRVAEANSMELFTIPAEGGAPKPLGITISGGFVYASLSPDGRRLLFQGALSPKRELWVMRNFLPQSRASRQ